MANDLIEAVCPECGATYWLQPDMAGKRMRCTDATCRAVFAVEQPVGVTAAMTPIPAAEEEPAPLYDWRDAPPPALRDAGDEVAALPQRHEVVPVTKKVVIPAQSSLPAGSNGKGRRRLVVAVLALFVISGATWGITSLVNRFHRAESRLAVEAAKAYSQGEYGKAAEQYSALAAEYPRGVRAGEYRFFADLARVRRQAATMPPSSELSLEQVTKFISEHDAGSLIKDHRAELFAAVRKTLTDLIDEGKELIANKKSDAAESKAKLAHQALVIAERHAPSGADTAGPKQMLNELTAALQLEKAKLTAREQILKLLSQAKPDLEMAQELIRRAGFGDDAIIKAELGRAAEKLRQLVTFAEKHEAALPARAIQTYGILPGAKAIGAGPRIPVLVRGVLMALDAKTGRVAWADRLGPDAVWPVVVQDPNRWIVVGSEPPMLMARDAGSGQVIWSQTLAALPVGPPVVTSGRIFVALTGPTGLVLVFNASNGEMHGAFATGQPLAGGIGHLPGSARLFVPTRAQQVLILDAAPENGLPHCLASLTTGHAAGSLRREPTVFPLQDGGTGLLLQIATGMDDTALSLFRIPDGPVLSAVPLGWVRVPGWTWYAPGRMGERLVAAGDRGHVSIFGLRQAGASDRPLFTLADAPPAATDHAPMPAAAWFAEDDSLLAVVGGRLKQLRLVIERSQGRKLAAGWMQPEAIGSPVQPPIIEAGIAYLVTQRTESNTTLATALRVDSGEVLWQRTIGFDISAPFMRIGNAIVNVDYRGAVLAVAEPEKTSEWVIAGRELAAPWPIMDVRPWLFREPSNQWIVAAPTGKGAVLRRIQADLTITEQRLELPAPLAGKPAIADDAAVLPLANGTLVRATSDGKATAGPTWRTPGSGHDSAGHVTHWYGDNFLVGDGHRRLMHLRWAGGADYELAVSSALERPNRFLGPPVLIPGTAARAVVADAGGNVILFRGNRLEVERTWRLGGSGKAITAGPELLGDLLLIEVDGKSLIALHPDREAPAWQFDLPDGKWIGLPCEFASQLAAADTLGRIWNLSAQTGRPAAAVGCLLPAGMVAAAGPVAWSANRLFVPLADGTAIAVTNEHLLQAKLE